MATVDNRIGLALLDDMSSNNAKTSISYVGHECCLVRSGGKNIFRHPIPRQYFPIGETFQVYASWDGMSKNIFGTNVNRGLKVNTRPVGTPIRGVLTFRPLLTLVPFRYYLSSPNSII